MLGTLLIVSLLAAPAQDPGAEPRPVQTEPEAAADEQEARDALRRAEGFVEDGFCERAHSELERLARRFPGTEAGRIAAKRTQQLADTNALHVLVDIDARIGFARIDAHVAVVASAVERCAER